MKKLRTAVIVVTTLALISGYPLLAQKAGCGHSMEKMGQGMSACNIPNLTAEQISKIQKLKLEFQKEILPLRQKMQTIRLEMRTLISEGADQKKLEAKIEESGKIRIEIQKKALAHRQEIRKLLTDEQKVYFDLRCSGMGHGCRGCKAGMMRHGNHKEANKSAESYKGTDSISP